MANRCEASEACDEKGSNLTDDWFVGEPFARESIASELLAGGCTSRSNERGPDRQGGQMPSVAQATADQASANEAAVDRAAQRLRRPARRGWGLQAGGCVALAMAAFMAVLGSPLTLSPLESPSPAYGGEAVLASDVADAADTVQLSGLQEKFEAISRKVSPSVVSISAAATPVDSEDALRGEELNPEKLETILDRTTRMVGTGFIIDADGYILTNEHVIGEAETVWVTTDDRKVYPALVVGSDPRADLAVLKIPATHLPAVRFAPYTSVRRGQWSIALGNPYGLATEGENCMSVGIISAMDRSLPKLARKENRLYTNLIQTTAQINPGNSGGPLFDLNGEVIGINTAVILPEKRTNGIGFAMPITPHLMATVHDIKEGKEVVYGYLGVTVSTPSERERRQAGLDAGMGVRVDNVESDSPADTGQMKENDFLVQINGELIRDSDHFVRVIGDTAVDSPAVLTIYRDGKVKTVTVTLKRRHLSNLAVTRESRRFRWQGLLLGRVPDNWEADKAEKANRFDKSDKPDKSDPSEKQADARTAGKTDTKAKPGPGGLMVLAISVKSHFSRESLNQGDVITAVAGRPVADVTDLQKIVNEVPLEKCDIVVAGKKQPVLLAAN